VSPEARSTGLSIRSVFVKGPRPNNSVEDTTMKRLTALLATTAALSLLLTAGTTSVSAAGGKVRPTGTETCWVSPNPTSNGQLFSVGGSGFRAGQVLNLRVDGLTLMTAADDTGSFLTPGTYANFRISGSKELKIYQSGDRHMTVLTTCTFIAN
jgi:hypothetical protein